MGQLEVRVEPDHITLQPGESQEVIVTVDSGQSAGTVEFPVHTQGAFGKGTLDVSTAVAVVFGKATTVPGNLPVLVELIDALPTSARFRVTAQEPKHLSRREKRKLGL